MKSIVHEIETARLRLRLFTPGDLDAVRTLFHDAEVMRYLGVEQGEVFSEEECERILRTSMEGWQKNGFSRWAVVDKSQEKFAGICGFRSSEGMPELVYVLAKEFWGIGLATEAAGASLRYAFEQLQLESVIAVTRPGHRTSRRILEKFGMSFEGVVSVSGIEVASYKITKEQFQPDSATYILHPV